MDERKEYILYNVFSSTYIVQEPGRYSHQIISVLFIDTAEGILTTAIKFPDKQLVFQGLCTFLNRINDHRHI